MPLHRTAPATDYLDPRCGVPLDAYMWIDTLHVGPTMHDALAAAIVADCWGEADSNTGPGLGLCLG